MRTGRDEPSTQAVVTLFQQTLKELRRRTEELEEMHHRERNRAEDGERMAEALCANLEAGYLRFGEDGHLSGVNAAARSLLGLQSVPRLGDIAAELLRDRQGVAKVLEEVQTTRALALREEVPGAPGTLLQVVGIPLFNLLHQLKGHLLILRDQTGVYQMRRTLREREALSRLGEVAAGVAHEVRNALSTISARLKLLGQDVPDLAENASFQALAEESRNLEQVMQNLLFFARPLPIEREPIDLLALLEEERGALGTQAEPLEVLVQGPPAVVGADREAMGRALRNLTRNSLEAMAAVPPGRKKLVLSTRLERGMAFLRVEDSGPGIPEGEDREAIFTPFFSQKPGGTGLGLAIARKIAREHGGDLVYFPSGPGGAGFELSLPRDSRPA
jgi:signal transduction histidine kinase